MLMKSSTELVRQQNSALVLSALRRSGPLSHTDISAQTGLASATVSVITAELERAHVIEKSEQPPHSGRGRPRVFFSQRRDCGYLIVVRISSDIVQYSMIDYSGTLIDRFEEPRNHGVAGTTDFVRSLLDSLDRLVLRSRLEKAQVLAISISSKGIVDSARPRLVWSPVFGSEVIDFAALLQPAWPAKVSLNNETLLVAQALGLRADKSGEAPFRALAALSLGHSIGVGVARKDRAGELEVTAPNFGHMLHSPSAGLCRCGSNGCIEAAAGFYGILRTAFEVPPDTIPAKFVPLAEMDKIAVSARQGNRMAGYAFRQAGIALGNGLSRMLSLYDRMPIFITGPGTRYFELLQKGIDEGLAQSHQVRQQGPPEISIIFDEQRLVFDGHLDRALTDIDHDIAALRLVSGSMGALRQEA
ncbi:ROK family transcriptional regulator [Pararhizobium antarcticum]|uniref:Transcriptional regulator n=1 Tax=Pararhizobium antarcticum TaxID=1798805 RepID=A0A657LTX1_9HYPH|nr:ROK family transcriptional regulator [Pararhizobium antarcticum]OJF94373.1 transcriptional regulator [Rhizobium sp. 58]OJF96906.1 transcriptional regulator [Pararhizobium antarcticum]